MRAFLTIGWLLLAVPAWAGQMTLLGAGLPGAAGPPPGYNGPGDVVSGSNAWYGLRAYNAAYATGSNNAAQLRRASDNTTSNIVILSSGDFDTASAVTFGGTDATCTGTIASTTLTISSCASGTLHVNDTISGIGITPPSFITAIGTCASPPGTCTINATQTVGVATTITASVALFSATMYDQSGGGHNVTQATAGQQPQFLPSCVGGLPCLYFKSAANDGLLNGSYSQAQPLTYSTVTNQLNSGQGYQISQGGSSEPRMAMNGASTAFIYAGTVLSATALINTWNNFQSVFNGASSSFVVNGAATAGAAGSGNGSGFLILGAADSALAIGPMEGYMTEAGSWPSAFNATQYGNMCHNQRLYWGTTGSC